MKKSISLAVVTVFCFLFLCSCGNGGKSDSPPEIPTDFTANATVQYNDLQINCDITVLGFNYCSIDFISPAVLEPLELIIENDNCKLLYNGLEYNISVSDLPGTAFGEQFAECISALTKVESLDITHQSSGDWLYKGKIKAGEFNLVQDGENGYIKAVEIPSIKFYVLVNEFTENGKGS